MTVEVAILNKDAVALAADSAATSIGRSGAPKIFETMKLFALSKSAPVGIMVYSSAELMEVPVETLIKVFRHKHVGNRPLGTLEEYCDSFKDFLIKETDIFPHAARLTHCEMVVWRYMHSLFNEIEESLQRPNWGEPTKQEAKATAIAQIGTYHRFHTGSKLLDGAKASVRRTLKRELGPVVNEVKRRFVDRYDLSQSEAIPVGEIATELFLREATSGFETGFVIAGFGTDEIFPQLRSFEIESSIHGVHKLRPNTSVDVAKEGAKIVAFGQPYMVDTFVRGRGRKLDQDMPRFIEGFFEKEKTKYRNNSKIEADTLKAVLSMFDTMSRDLKKEFLEELEKYTQQVHVGPVEQTISIMPKRDLAVMAEALVNITALKRRSTPDAETVGGPTDVAVISKGDGLVWIKRKHYFEPELNPGFIQNYTRREDHYEGPQN